MRKSLFLSIFYLQACQYWQDPQLNTKQITTCGRIYQISNNPHAQAYIVTPTQKAALSLHQNPFSVNPGELDPPVSQGCVVTNTQRRTLASENFINTKTIIANIAHDQSRSQFTYHYCGIFMLDQSFSTSEGYLRYQNRKLFLNIGKNLNENLAKKKICFYSNKKTYHSLIGETFQVEYLARAL